MTRNNKSAVVFDVHGFLWCMLAGAIEDSFVGRYFISTLYSIYISPEGGAKEPTLGVNSPKIKKDLINEFTKLI